MALLTKLADTKLLLQEWLSAPKRIGAVAPSSQRLAAAMACWVPREARGLVVELGAGTGAVTQALLAQGVSEKQLVAVENTPAMTKVLRRRFPRVQVIEGDARSLAKLLRPLLPTGESVATIVSSLPLRHFSSEDAAALARQIRALLPPQGRWIQFTYHIGNGKPPGGVPFKVRHSDVVWLNLPPARVLVYEK
ncbi:MAG TPA: methyltransferase domain-containing protein [Verrucomicrobiae bacterium]